MRETERWTRREGHERERGICEIERERERQSPQTSIGKDVLLGKRKPCGSHTENCSENWLSHGLGCECNSKSWCKKTPDFRELLQECPFFEIGAVTRQRERQRKERERERERERKRIKNTNKKIKPGLTKRPPVVSSSSLPCPLSFSDLIVSGFAAAEADPGWVLQEFSQLSQKCRRPEGLQKQLKFAHWDDAAVKSHAGFRLRNQISNMVPHVVIAYLPF